MALFGKKSKGLVGVDIGSAAIKAVELKTGGKGGSSYQLVNIGMEALPPEAIVDGAIMDSGSVIDAIQRLFTSQKIKTGDVATSVSGNAVIVKKISLPQMSAEELQESIHWEAEQYIPFDIQEVALDYEVIEGGTGGNMDVLLVAAKKDKITDYTSAISQAGKSPQIVDVDVFALQNCYEVNYGVDAGKVVLLLNVGASIMNINIVKGTSSIFNRDIPAVGGNQYTDAIQKDLNLSFEQAEALKKGARVEAASPESLQPILHSVSENIALEVQKTFDFFKATTSEDRVDQIFLSGGTAKIQGLRELLAERFETGVEILNPFNSVTYNPRDFDPEFINEIGPAAAIAVGLAVRRVGDR